MKVIRCLAFADGQPIEGEPWLAAYDPDGNDGAGDVDVTTDPAQALRFETTLDAMNCWKQISTVRPLRIDGKPNRPLTAVTIEVTEEPPTPVNPGDEPEIGAT